MGRKVSQRHNPSHRKALLVVSAPVLLKVPAWLACLILLPDRFKKAHGESWNHLGAADKEGATEILSEMQHYTGIAEPRSRAKSLRQCSRDRQNTTKRAFC
jgi:hypothetical protein